MRLSCPSCGAQYEVPSDVIPPDGRDVQCSNCDTTWFQEHPDFAEDAKPVIAEAAPAPADPEPAKADAEPPTPAEEDPDGITAEFEADLQAALEQVEKAKQDQAPDQPPEPAKATEPEPAADATPPAEAPAPPKSIPVSDPPPEAKDKPAPSRQKLDPDVADILRQEAVRETAARHADAIETQPDLGLEDAQGQQTDPAPARQVAAVGATAASATAAAAATIAQNDQLPDIEEINSTLRSTSDRDLAGDDPDPAAPGRVRQQRSFRRGFWLMLTVFLIAALVYVYTPQLAQMFPAAEPALTDYVGWVDGLRQWLDLRLRDLMQWLETMLGSSAAADG